MNTKILFSTLLMLVIVGLVVAEDSLTEEATNKITSPIRKLIMRWIEDYTGLGKVTEIGEKINPSNLAKPSKCELTPEFKATQWGT